MMLFQIMTYINSELLQTCTIDVTCGCIIYAEFIKNTKKKTHCISV